MNMEMKVVNEYGNESSYSNGDHSSHPILPRTTGVTVAAGSRFAVGTITSATGLERITPTKSSKYEYFRSYHDEAVKKNSNIRN